MKKILALLLALVMVLGLFAGCSGNTSETKPSETEASTPETTEGGSNEEETTENNAGNVDMKVAMITDYGDITDQSFNQTTYETMKAWCAENGVPCTYFKPEGDSTAQRVAMVDAAVAEGYNVILMPGFAFGETIAQTADVYPDVTFIALDVSEGDLGGYTLPANVFSAVYQEELSGYMAGYAAVMLGYRHLGYLGGMGVPAVLRFGYGYLQGIDAAATELGCADEITVEWAYGNQFYGDADITAAMDAWYGEKNVEVVFACGGGIYTSVAEAASKIDGKKVIGVDVDQAAIIDAYGEGMTVTSAMKGLANTVTLMLDEVAAGNFANYGGTVQNLGLVSGDDPTANYVQIPMESTQWSDDFTQDDYKALVKGMFDGTIVVSNAIDAMPEVAFTVNDYGNLK